MEEIKLRVYEEDMETVKKECTANMVKVPFGLIRKLMKLFNVENMEDTSQILKVVTGSWDEVIKLLDRVFSGVEEEEWDYVDTKDLVKAIYDLIKYAFGELLSIPTDPKN